MLKRQAKEKERIRTMYSQGMSLSQIGKVYGVCDHTVMEWMKVWGLKRRRAANPDKWNGRRAEIEHLYHIQALSQHQIAAYYGVTQRVICQVMKRLNIPRRDRARRGPQHYGFKNGLHNRDYRKLIVKDQCSRCGATTNLCIHHKNNDHFDNRLENLEILCSPCHLSEAKRLWWKAKKAGKKTPKSNGPVGWARCQPS